MSATINQKGFTANMNSVDISTVSTRQSVRYGFAWISHQTRVSSPIAKPVEMVNGMGRIITLQHIFVVHISILVRGAAAAAARIVRSVEARAVVTTPQWMC